MKLYAGTRPLTVLFIAAVVASGCGGATTAPAGGTPTSSPSSPPSESPGETLEPTVLRMAVVPGLADAHVDAFLAELAGNAESPLDIVPSEQIDVQFTLGAEQEIIRAVADGTLALGWVGARAFRELGVTDFDPLVAPMLLDSMEGQRKVLESGLPAEMLSGLEPLDVTGLAVFAGALRRPIAAAAPLTSLADFQDVPFYTWHGELNGLATQALGAQHVDMAPEDRNAAIEDGSIRAYENTIGFLAANADWQANAMTLNLNLWPSMSVLVANTDALAALSDDAQAALTDAAAAVAAQSVDRLPDEQSQIEAACEGGATFTLASDTNVAEIRAAFEPVFEQLRSDDTVAVYLDEIERLIEGTAPETLTIPDDCVAPSSDGTTQPPRTAGGG